MTTDLIMRVDVRTTTTTTTTTAALKARNLKRADQIYFVDYNNHKFFTSGSSIARANDMLSRRYLYLYLYYNYQILLLCH